MASFLSSILSNRDNEAFILGALQIAELLLTKMPKIYTRSFHREGVFFEVEKLAKEELSPSARSSQRQPQLKERRTSDRLAQDKAANGNTAARGQEDFGLPPSLSTQSLGAVSGNNAIRKVSSVPSDPHDVNIVRARILCIKADLGAISKETVKQEQSPAASIVKTLEKPNISSEAFRDLMRRVAILLTDTEEPLSSFELLQSGLLNKLMELIADAETSVVHDRRHILFDELSKGNGETSALVILIKRLQESLSRMETFEVQSATSGLEESKGSSLNNLVRQIRLRLVAEDGTDLPRVCKEMVVSVQAIAPLSAINSWLRSRVISISNGGNGAANGLSSMLEAAYAGRFDNQSGNPPSNNNPAGATTTGKSAADKSKKTTSASTSDQKQSAADDASSRRRSARLRGKGPVDDGAAAASETQGPDAAVSASAGQHVDDSAGSDDDDIHFTVESAAHLEDDEDHGEDDEGDSDMDDDYEDVIFEDDMDDDMHDALEHPQEQTVDLSVPDDGSKPEATTPSGTRVATPTNGTSAAESSKTGDLPPKLGSYAAAVRAPPSDWHFQFLIGNDELSMADTVYGALHRNQSAAAEGKPKQSIFWQQPIIKFRKVDGPAPVVGIQSAVPAQVEPASTSALPSTLPIDSAQATVLRMLRVLHALNTEKQDSDASGNNGAVDDAVFINPKLTAKFARQLEELVIVASNCLPDWAMELPTHFPFLFPFEARYTYLQSTSFGYSRLISKWMTQQGPTESNRRLGMLDALPRVQRSRVRISRNKILESAARVMELYGASPGVLEIEYQDEEGTGLGPTLEFYTLVSKAFAERRLGLWRDEDESHVGAYVYHPRGLFPRPLRESEALQHPAKSDYPLFKSLGTFVGKALLDSRIIDINFNKVLLRAVMGETLPLDLTTLRQVDPGLARTVDKFQKIVDQKLAIQSDSDLSDAEKTQQIAALRLDGAEISDLGLDFVLPGDHSIELIVSLPWVFPVMDSMTDSFSFEIQANGASVPVTIDNVQDYVSAILDHTLRKGISRQVEAFREGKKTQLSLQPRLLTALDNVALAFRIRNDFPSQRFECFLSCGACSPLRQSRRGLVAKQ